MPYDLLHKKHHKIMQLNAMIVDDSIEAHKLLERFCNRYENIDLVAQYENAQLGLERLEQEDIDLVFLDVEMPNMTGIEFLERAPMLPMVIFTTSKSEYAYTAFEFKAVDYLKKPFNYKRFSEGVSRAFEFWNAQHTEKSSSTDLPNFSSKSIFVKEKGRHVRVDVDDILYFENVSDYVRIHTKEKQHLIYSTLKNVDAKLTSEQFLRVHRSYIVNLEKIVDIEEYTLVIGRTVIPIGKAHKSKLMKRLQLI